MTLFKKKSGEETDRERSGGRAATRPGRGRTGLSYRESYRMGYRPKTVEEIEIEKRRMERSTRRLDELDKAILTEETEGKKTSKTDAAREAIGTVTGKAGRRLKRTIGKKIPKEKEAGVRLMTRVLLVLIAVALGFVFSRMFCRSVEILEGSMTPTLTAGDTYLIDSLVYKIRKPRRGEIIAFRTDDMTESIHVKRVIGLPGDTVQIKKGVIYINGSRYEEAKDFPEIVDAGLATEPIKLDPGDYFVLGDNRNGSEDSRYAAVGNVSVGNIAGKVWFRIAPIKKFGPV